MTSQSPRHALVGWALMVLGVAGTAGAGTPGEYARGLLKRGSRRDVLGNALVLIAPAHSPLRLDITPGFGTDCLLSVYYYNIQR